MQDCVADRFDSADGLGYSTSRAVCIDCADACSEYSCSGETGLLVLSPCTAVQSTEECGAFEGSLRIISTETESEPASGYSYILQWFGALWGFVIVSVLFYDALRNLAGQQTEQKALDLPCTATAGN